MRIRTRVTPFVVAILLPGLAAGLSDPSPSDTQAIQRRQVLEAAPVKDYTGEYPGTSTLVLGPTAKPAVGTKDAPVDGLDGKPHAGPFVDTSPSEKKGAAVVEDAEKALPTSLEKLKKEGYASDDGWALIPEKNDGVMNDPNRAAPKEGTTGTEGGVSQRTRKDKSLDSQLADLEKTVESPKEAPPLPADTLDTSLVRQTPQDDDPSKVTTLTGKPKGAQGLEKPDNLPDTPKTRGSPDTKAATLSSESNPNLMPTLPYSEGKKPKTSTSNGAGDETLIQPLHSFILSFTMIIFSEIGDKTFLVAVVMSMRHARILVFSAALSALAAMTVLSALLGHAAPTLLPKELTAFAAAILFLVFGAKMLREGMTMDPNLGVNEEMKEVEGEIDEKEHEDKKMGRRKSSISVYALEAGRGRRSGAGDRPKAPLSPSSSDDEDALDPSSRSHRSTAKAGMYSAVGGLTNLLSLLLSPAWVNTFVMTFTGEWGDRSQIATIAMAAGQDYWWVIAGAITGHAICTGLAVIAGSLLAGRIRLRIGEPYSFSFSNHVNTR